MNSRILHSSRESSKELFRQSLNTENFTDKLFPTPTAAGDAPNNRSNKEGRPAEHSVGPLVAVICRLVGQRDNKQRKDAAFSHRYSVTGQDIQDIPACQKQTARKATTLNKNNNCLNLLWRILAERIYCHLSNQRIKQLKH